MVDQNGFSAKTAHYALEATPTKINSTGGSESCSDKTITSPVTKIKFKIGDLYVAMTKKPLLATQKCFFAHCYVQIPQWPDFEIFFGDRGGLGNIRTTFGSSGTFFFVGVASGP